MHCLFIPFLATIVPVRKAVRNYQFLQYEFVEEKQNPTLGEISRPWQGAYLTSSEGKPLSLGGFQLQVMYFGCPSPSQ